MPAVAPRTKTPAVEPVRTGDVTERESAPPSRPSPVAAVSPPPVRSRKETLVSPIPALLAASMGEIREDQCDATPLPIEVRGEETSRFAFADQEALLMEDDSDYVVEVGDTLKTGR
jgi:hypothetical protein